MIRGRSFIAAMLAMLLAGGMATDDSSDSSATPSLTTCAAVEKAMRAGYASISGRSFIDADGEVQTRILQESDPLIVAEPEHELEAELQSQKYRAAAIAHVEATIFQLLQDKPTLPLSPEAASFFTLYTRCLSAYAKPIR